MSQSLIQAIEQTLEQSQGLVAAFNSYVSDESDDNLTIIIERSEQRAQGITALFSNYSKDQLAQFPSQLSNIAVLDKQLIELGSSLKDVMAKRVIKQKRNKKATNAYTSS